MLIDVSHHNVDAGPINWAKADTAIDGAYIKITEGVGYVDPKWTGSYAGARGAGIPCGAYHFADLGSPTVEADHFADVYLSRTWQLRPVLDIETPGSSAAWLIGFRAQFRKRVGTRAFRVYTSYDLLRHALVPTGWIDPDTDIWAARYNSTLDWDHPQLVLWQNSSVAHVAGLVGDTDVDQYQHGWTPAMDTLEDPDMQLTDEITYTSRQDGKPRTRTVEQVLAAAADLAEMYSPGWTGVGPAGREATMLAGLSTGEAAVLAAIKAQPNGSATVDVQSLAASLAPLLNADNGAELIAALRTQLEK